jgi:hypothetical protein
MPLTIPFFNDIANFSEELTLEDTSYRLEFVYNWRSGQWSMSVLDIDLIPLVSGIPLVTNFNLFDQYPGRNLPAGEFYVVDTTEEEIEVTRENMGTILELVYIPEDELDTI